MLGLVAVSNKSQLVSSLSAVVVVLFECHLNVIVSCSLLSHFTPHEAVV